MKFRLYWRSATRSLVRGGQRTTLAIMCVAVGVLAVVALQLVSTMVTTGLTGDVRALNGGDIVVRSAPGVPFTSRQLTAVEHLATTGDITTLTSVYRDFLVQATGRHTVSHVEVRAVDPAHFPLAGPPVFSTPGILSLQAALRGPAVVLTADLAQTLGVGKDAPVTITFAVNGASPRAATATVGAIIANTGLFQQPELIMTFAHAAHLHLAGPLPLSANELFIDVPSHSTTAIAYVRQDLEGQLSGAQITTTQDLLQSNQATAQSIRLFLQALGLLALLIGGVGILHTMQVLLRRRTTEIAVLKTVGYRRRDLYALFGLEAGLLGLSGGVCGAVAGTGVAFLLKALIERLFAEPGFTQLFTIAGVLHLPTVIDLQTVGSGVLLGCATALIFGLLPIVRAGEVRPLSVLRDLPQPMRSGSAWLTAGLLGLLTILFYLLALSILQDGIPALAVVLGGGITLVLLDLGGVGMVWLLSHLSAPIPLRWWYVFLVLFATLAALLLTALFRVAGALALFAVALLVVAALAPRSWKADIKLALRNLGRQKTRRATLLVALCLGNFALGLILVLGLGIKQTADITAQTTTDALISVGTGVDRAAVMQYLQRTPGISLQARYLSTGTTPVTLGGSVFQSQAYGEDTLSQLSTIQGFDLALNQSPSLTDITITQGRTLTRSDAGSTAVLLDDRTAHAPLNLKPGDRLTVTAGASKGSSGVLPTNQQLTLMVVGFYRQRSFFAPEVGILGDMGVVTTLSAGTPTFLFAVHVDPQNATDLLAQLQHTVPQAHIENNASVAAQMATVLDSTMLLLGAVAGLTVLAALIIMANMVALALLEQRRELGILKAVGYTSRRVLAMTLIEQGLLGFAAAILALLPITLIASLLSQLGGFVLPLSLPLVLGLVGSSVLLCLLVATSVAWRATQVRPLEVLRYE
ncbi:MAG TPA: FtsX-like permease family protein [Ktedonobacteraceae bacterium]